jgi:hypothetical protein
MYFVKPKKGQVVRFPESMIELPVTGAWVEGLYWTRRIHDGDVIIAVQTETKEGGDEAVNPTGAHPVVERAFKDIGSALSHINNGKE